LAYITGGGGLACLAAGWGVFEVEWRVPIAYPVAFIHDIIYPRGIGWFRLAFTAGTGSVGCGSAALDVGWGDTRWVGGTSEIGAGSTKTVAVGWAGGADSIGGG
jgi:hypothetical protein